jgi:Cellulase (glycosyl hydrolase family 5)/NedA-like, galactose-binding domain
MRKAPFLPALSGILLSVSILAGCASPTSPPEVLPSPSANSVKQLSTASSVPDTPTAIVIPSPTASITITPTALPAEHRIAVRVIDGSGELYDRLTGEKFIPRGNNYIRTANQRGYSGEWFNYHSTFNTGLYNPAEVETALGDMQAMGYNTVRVFIQGSCKDSCIGDPTEGLSHSYLANVTDFLQKAKSHGIVVILTTDGEPGSPYYNRLLDTTWSKDFGGTNRSFLTGGGILVAQQFWQDLIGELKSQNAPLDAILAFELRNELFYEANAPPLSYTRGSFKTVNGKIYDMAIADDRQRMMDENLLYWIEHVRDAILVIDPTALVTIGFFVPQGPNPARVGDNRLIETHPVIESSSLDFIDLHPYPGFSISLSQYAENFGLTGKQPKPILMGEFGAIRSSYSSTSKAARALQDWQMDSCQFGFSGWLLWTYDMPDQVFYNGLSDTGEINQVLAPINRPDPCQAGSFEYTDYNLALGVRAEASRSLTDQPPSGAVDGDNSHWWGAGAFAPQWILIDLGVPKTIGSIRLTVTQSPNGDTLHQVWVGSTLDDLYLLHTFDGFTLDGQVLEYTPEIPLENVRYIKVSTRQSPSWVGWKEIEVLAP